MKYQTETIYHIFNQGNNRQNLFFSQDNYLFFLKNMRKFISPNVHFLAYCLMPNHFHWLVYTKEKGVDFFENPNSDAPSQLKKMQNLSIGIRYCLSSYTKAINKQKGWSGSLFRQKTKVVKQKYLKLTDSNNSNFHKGKEDFAINCFNYIHENPVKAKLVEEKTNWIYSSYKDYVGLRNGTLCNKVLAEKLGLFI